MKKINNDVKINNYALVVALVIFVILIIRMGYLSLSPVVDNINLQEFASNRITRTITLNSKRGTIYDINNNVLSQDVSSYTLIAYLDSNRTSDPNKPNHVVDKENTALVLSAILEMDYNTILKYLSKENVYQTEFGTKGKGLNEIVKDRIKSANLPGIDFIETTKRYYPYGDFASYVIGYAKESDDELIGELGIEKYYNDILTGKDGYITYQKGRNGYKIAGTKEVKEDEIDGSNIYLTIDSNIQFFVENAIKSTSNYSYDGMSIAVMEAKTGKILAYGISPSFDPNKRNVTNYLDSISGIAFEPGSTMKIYTYMAALESGVYKGNDTYKSGIFTTTDKTVIKDWNNVGWGTISYDQGFIYSSNTGVVNIMNKYMDANTLKKYLLRLGFGTKTNITLPLEVSGKISFKYETEIYNAAFGQGITTTPIQHLRALTAISNNGVMIEPYIVDKIKNSVGEIIVKNSKNTLGKVASEETIEYMKNLMWHTINDSDGAAHGYAINGFNIIGKTGTAQIASTNGTGYLSGSNDLNRSVAIMFPKEDPEIIIYGVAKKSSTSAPLSKAVKSIIQNIAKYRNMYSEEESKNANAIYEMGNFLNNDVSKLEEIPSNLNKIVLGNGKNIIAQYPLKNSAVTINDKIFFITDDVIKMPNVIGYSKNDITTLANLLDLDIILNGNGYVESQSIKPGEIIDKSKTLEINLNTLYS